MTRLEQVGVLHRVGVDLVSIGRNVDFLLAQVLPVVANGRAIEETVRINGQFATGAGQRLIKAIFRNLAHASSARVITPAQALFLAKLHGLRDHAHAPLLTLGQLDDVRPLRHRAGQRLPNIGGIIDLAECLVVSTTPDDTAIRQHIGVVSQSVLGESTRWQQVIEGQLKPALGDGERQGSLDCSARTQPICIQHGALCILPGSCTHCISKAEVTMPLIHRNAIGLGITRKHGLLALSQPLGVLTQVFRRDREQRLFIGIRINRMLTRMSGVLNAGGRTQPFTRELRHSTGRACFFPTRTSQRLAQFRYLFWRRLGPHRPHQHRRCTGHQYA